MAKQIAQYRFYGDQASEKNYPNTYSSYYGSYKNEDVSSGYEDGSIFSDLYPLLSIGIQTLPGVKFSLNESEPIQVGSTGIFALSLDGISEINNLTFDKTSLERIADDPIGYLIVDLISSKEE